MARIYGDEIGEQSLFLLLLAFTFVQQCFNLLNIKVFVQVKSLDYGLELLPNKDDQVMCLVVFYGEAMVRIFLAACGWAKRG